MLYKLWSGFTKNLRYLLLSKLDAAVKLGRIGTFTRSINNETGLICFGFQPASELSNAVSGESASIAVPATADPTVKIVSPDWQRIAESARVQTADTAKSLVQALFACAVSCQHDAQQI